MIRGLILFGLFLVVLRAGFLFAAPVVKNTMLEGKIQDVSSNRGLKSESDIRHEVMEYIEDKHIDLTDDEVYFEMTERGCHIAAHYTTEVSFLKLTRTYEFFPASSESARRKAQNHFRYVAAAAALR